MGKELSNWLEYESSAAYLQNVFLVKDVDS